MKKLIPLITLIAYTLPVTGMEETIHEKIERLVQDVEEQLKTDIDIAADILAPTLKGKIEGEQPAIKNNRYKNTHTRVRHNNTISTGEREYRQKREETVREKLQELIPQYSPEKNTPIIAGVFSGGGMRALLATLGTKRGLEEEGLLKLLTYTVTLSGSTWAEAPLISSKTSISKFTNYAHKRLEKPFHITTKEERLLISNMIAVKELSNQPLTLVDIYGGLLGNTLLEYKKEKRHMTYLSQQASLLKSSDYPYPLYSAVSRDGEWYAFTPHKVANLDHGLSIPTYGCGREYENKKSQNTAPEIPLSILLGTFGAAFDADFNRIIDAAAEKYPSQMKALEKLKRFIQPIGDQTPLPFELKLPNFAKGMNTPISNSEFLEIHDAGIEINLGYPLISGLCPERKADIILFFDNSAGETGKELQKCAEFAQKHNLPFPAIDLTDIGKKTMSIFKDNKPETPLIIYMPGISDHALWEHYQNDPRFARYNLSQFDLKKETDEGFCQTQYFQYTRDNARLVTYQTRFNLRTHTQDILEAIKWKTENMLQ